MISTALAHLEVHLGGEVRRAPLEAAVTRIGRGVSADLLLDDPTVSRRHALVVRRGDAFVLCDDRSMNGTWVNGERVQETTLADGDLIELGAVRLRFLGAPAPAPS